MAYRLINIIMLILLTGYTTFTFSKIENSITKLNREIIYSRLMISDFYIDLNELNAKIDKKKVIKVKVTAFTPSVKECGKADGITASNKKLKPGHIAVSRDLFFGKGFTFGKKVFIEGLGIFTVQDLMAKYHKKSVDIAMFNVKKATKFGVKHERKITLLDEI